MKKNICIVGLGYIGLPTATMFAKYGHNVYGVDVNKYLVEELNRGNIIIEEPYLPELVKEVVGNGNLKAGIRPKEADIFIISVPTPIKEDKTANMDHVISATKSIVKYLKRGNIVVLESTSPVGTTEEVVKPIIERSGLKVGSDLLLGYSPERVIPGNIINEMKNNNRVIGGVNKTSAEEISVVYETIVEGSIYLTDCKTAEMCKLMENTYRDVNIALANELLLICDDLGINVWDVIKYSNKHPRVNIHLPGAGVGGHCLAVDPWFVVEKEPKLSKIIKSSREINDSMPSFVYKTIENILENQIDKKVTILGITYKANVDDVRESPIIKLIDLLIKNQYEVVVYDPYVKEYYLGKDNLIEACENSDLIVLGVNHDEFKYLPYNLMKESMKGNLILDTRNFLDEDEVIEYGLEYKLLGAK